MKRIVRATATWGGAFLVALVASIREARAAHVGDDPKPPAGIADPAAVLASVDLHAVVVDYATHAHRIYIGCETLTAAMKERIEAFVTQPDTESLLAARRSWSVAREQYAYSEALRFSGGPIDDSQTGIETLMNAWPIDEAYIDRVVGAPDAGIINDPKRCPDLNRTILTVLNQRGGETNVSLGWHAIEFLLWGQDLDANGPGARSPEDYKDSAPNAARRRAYLILITQVLLEHIKSLRQAWEPDQANYRKSFEARDPKDAIRTMLTGLRVLSGSEMSAERMAVAYETRDQEQETSCFSDTTLSDLLNNQLGIIAVYFGKSRGGAGPGLRVVSEAVDAETAHALEAQLEASLAALRAIPGPFDQAIIGDDESPGRKSIAAAIDALKAESDSFAFLGRRLGFKIPASPKG